MNWYLTKKNISVFLCIVLFAKIGVPKKQKENKCEVCLDVMRRYIANLGTQSEDAVHNEAVFRNNCRTAGGPEGQFCFYVGGLDNSINSVVHEIVQAVKFGIPPEKICSRLKQQTPDVCTIKYEKPVEMRNLEKMKIKDFKRLLAQWGETDACMNCVEKADYLRVVQQLIPRYAPQYAPQYNPQYAPQQPPRLEL